MPNIVTLKSFPFDSMQVLNEESRQMEDDRLYEAEIFRKYFAKFLSNGVYFGHYKNYNENSMKVILDTGLTVKVLAGAGIINGADYELENDTLLTLERPATGNRIDRIVIKVDDTLAVRETQLYVKVGNGETPANLQRDENIYEICIAEVTVKSTSNISAEDIKDTRLDTTLCGIVNSLITVDGKELYERFQGYIDEVTENLVRKDQDNTITGNLTVNGTINGNLNGNAETSTHADSATNADTATASKSCTGNSTTASKLATPRNITLSGAISGTGKFDGSIDVTITTKQANIAVLTGSMSLSAGSSGGDETQTQLNINFPSGFNKDNCVCIAFGMKLQSKNYHYGVGGTSSNRVVSGSFIRDIVLGAPTDDTKIQLVAYNAGNKVTVNYNIVLMKIS